MGAPVMQFQILAKDPDRAARFYGDLFDWSVNAANPLGYRQLDTGSERGIHGGIWPAPPGAPAFVQLFVEVDDVAATLARAGEMDGRTVIPPSKLPGGDEMAVLLDPEGIAVGLWKPA